MSAPTNTLVSNFKEEQKDLGDAVRRLDFRSPSLKTQERYKALLKNNPPIDRDLILALQRDVEAAYAKETDEDRRDLLDVVLGALVRLDMLNEEIRRTVPLSVAPYPTLPKPLPSAPPQTLPPVNPAALPPPQSSKPFLPPVIKVVRFELPETLQVTTQEQADAQEILLNDITQLNNMIKKTDGNNPERYYRNLFLFLIKEIELPVQYNGVAFSAVRKELNMQIDALFASPPTQENEIRLRTLNSFLQQTHQIMHSYYQMRLAFGIPTVEEAAAAASAVKPTERGRFLGILEHIAAQEDDEDEDE